MAERVFFHVGLLVEDIERARDELSQSLGITWSDVVVSTIGDWTNLVSFSRNGPPYIELLQGQPGGPWDPAGGSRIDHIAYFSEELERDRDALAQAGLAIETDGTKLGGRWCYHRGSESGLRVELLDAERRAGLAKTFGLSGLEADSGPGSAQV